MDGCGRRNREVGTLTRRCLFLGDTAGAEQWGNTAGESVVEEQVKSRKPKTRLWKSQGTVNALSERLGRAIKNW
ncbi:hypothetical protein NPIL_609661 [Nephila pilipes]|nr:hypothetical protein NPIL_609661 [Nephila pilipes]